MFFVALLIVGWLADLVLNPFLQFMILLLMINMILGMSLNLVNGFAGQFSLGHAGFMAIGGYVSASLAEIWWSRIGAVGGLLQIPFFIGLALIAGGAAALAGWVVGLPSLRLKGDYLAIVTLGFAEIIRVILLNTEAVGGARGFYDIKGPGDLRLGPLVVSQFLQFFAMTLFWVILCFVTIWRLVRSAHGRGFLSVRDDEIAAQAMGINTTQAKVRAFALSSFFAGVAGSIFAHNVGYLSPSSFGFNRSVDAVIIVVLGGMGSLSGSLLAATLVTLIPELLRPVQDLTGVDVRMIIYSFLLILMMILRPAGLCGSHELPEIWKKFALTRRAWAAKNMAGRQGRPSVPRV
ncbi:MAG: branched-chain amino acid ABC transporter permease [Bdellovibrio sp.]|nr:MAG: branched-chain amino acid ABC transporter permease [Bdellovibrio sp.]